MRIAQASKDENGKISGGVAGNQGNELQIRSWYNRPWNVVLRAKMAETGVQIANVAESLVRCRKIGYDQSNRLSLWDECEKIHWNISRIDEISPCECDCSSLVAVVLRFCGIAIPKTAYTGNLQSYIMGTGIFMALSGSQWTTTDAYLQRGDILLNTAHHVAIALDNGEKLITKPFAPYAAVVAVSSYLNVRTGPGTEYRVMKVNGKDFCLPPGLVVAVCEEKSGWGRLSDLSGWVSLQYLSH